MNELGFKSQEDLGLNAVTKCNLEEATPLASSFQVYNWKGPWRMLRGDSFRIKVNTGWVSTKQLGSMTVA